jgi:hypothetical protein
VKQLGIGKIDEVVLPSSRTALVKECVSLMVEELEQRNVTGQEEVIVFNPDINRLPAVS